MFRRNLIPVRTGIILLSGMFLMGQETECPWGSGVVTFPDPVLESQIRWCINIPSPTPICASDLEGMPGCGYLHGRGITDLTGLEYCTGFTSLDLGDNQISDLSPLAGMRNLKDLDLSGNQISDLTPLAGLTGLEWLRLSDNQIIDLSPLAGMTNLAGLYANSNQIIDLSPLAGMTGIWWFQLSDNQIGDIYPLVQNSGIGYGDSVVLLSNPLDETSCTVYIPELESRGVWLYHTCQ